MHRLSRFMACGILVPRLGIELISLGLQDKFPTSKPPGKSPSRFFFKLSFKAPLTDRDTHPGTGVVRRKIVNSEFHSSAPGGENHPEGLCPGPCSCLAALQGPHWPTCFSWLGQVLCVLALGISYQSPFCFYYLCEAETCPFCFILHSL